jgi:hypothetical protein
MDIRMSRGLVIVIADQAIIIRLVMRIRNRSTVVMTIQGVIFPEVVAIPLQVMAHSQAIHKLPIQDMAPSSRNMEPIQPTTNRDMDKAIQAMEHNHNQLMAHMEAKPHVAQAVPNNLHIQATDRHMELRWGMVGHMGMDVVGHMDMDMDSRQGDAVAEVDVEGMGKFKDIHMDNKQVDVAAEEVVADTALLSISIKSPKETVVVDVEDAEIQQRED